MAGPLASIRAHRFASSIVAGVVGGLLTAAAAHAQLAGLGRVDLQQHDLDIPGHETVQVRVDFPPKAVAARHKHPGEEIVYVLKGTLEYRLDGKPPVTLKTGDVLFIPTGTVHAVTNVGDDSAS